jgi:lipopolysaccharide export system protein LptA
VISKRYIILISIFLFLSVVCPLFASGDVTEDAKKEPVIITSRTLTADNKNHTAVFEGSVKAVSGDIEMYSDRMTVYYNESKKKINRIHAVGNVKVHRKNRALFADEAVYLEDERKIIFTGNPKVVEGENVITGRQITFFLEDDRAMVEGSKVYLKNSKVSE